MAMSMISVVTDDESFVVLGSSPPDSAAHVSMSTSISHLSCESTSRSLHALESGLHALESDLHAPQSGLHAPESGLHAPESGLHAPDSGAHDLAGLAEENSLLRATLADNNRTQREQLLRLAAAQDEVARAQREHTQRFRDTRTLVVQLRSENQQLREEVRQLARARQETDERVHRAETRWQQVEIERQELAKQMQSATNSSPNKHELESRQLNEKLTRLEGANQDMNGRLQLAELKYQQAAAERDDLAKQARTRSTQHQSADTLAAALVSRDEELARLRTVAEERELLQAQLQVYRDDFAAEREARAKLAGEKEDLLAQLRGLQSRNQQLTQQLEEIRRINPSILEHTGATSKQPNSEPTLLCPVCGEGSASLALLDYHLLRCLPD